MGLRGELGKVFQQIATHPKVIRVVSSQRFIRGLTRALELPAEAVARVRSVVSRSGAGTPSGSKD
jgi:hypothetical protein